MRTPLLVLAFAALSAGGWGLVVLAQGDATPAEAPDGPDFDREFWDHWSDGRAEVAAYDLTFPRYGEAREGVATAIFVKEPFSEADRVKADPGRPEEDVLPVMKLNLVQDFSTGVYDYNLMTSVFLGLEPSGGRPAGAPAKVSFSSQEWCGHVYHQLLFDEDRVREELHSYFDGEADREGTLAAPAGGLSEDAVLLWARGWVAPRLDPGESREVPLLPATAHARLQHEPLSWTRATVSRSEEPEDVTVPAGTFEADAYRLAVADGRTWTVHVERALPHRVVRWETTSGQHAELIGVERLAYWKLNGPGGGSVLERIGLSPRPERTP